MTDLLPRRILRGIAVVIAIAAVVDPGIETHRAERPVVVVTAPDSARNAALADAVSRTLNSRFDVSRVHVAGASAAVVVGDGPPAPNDALASPSFLVLPDTAAASVAIERVDVPASVSADSRVPVVARIVVHGAAGRSLDVTLRAGSVVAARATRTVSGNDTTISFPLSFVPVAGGTVPLRVSATLGGAQTANADAATEVRDRRWPILFFDPRPSWTSTFVRRSIERDPRFAVTSRVGTSRGVSTDAGRPPARLDDPGTLAAWDAVVIGAPEGLSATEVTALANYMRRRGGAVVFLLDQRIAGPYDRLTGVTAWTTRSISPASLPSVGPDSSTLRAGEIAFPTTLPAGATIMVGGPQPVVWESAVGAGRLVVSGALDAWHFRDPSSSGFETFWRQTVADAANGSPPPVSIVVSSSMVKPGDAVDVRATVRSADASWQTSRAAAASLSARIVRTDARVASHAAAGDSVDRSALAVRLFPDGPVGEFAARIRAPRSAGIYRVIAVSDGFQAEAPVVVDSQTQRARPSQRNLADAWARARGGRAFRASESATLLQALVAAVKPPVHLENWHPLRSAWWMLPFALALSAEWWLRRRRGLP